MVAAARVRFTIEFDGGPECGPNAKVYGIDLRGVESDVYAGCEHIHNGSSSVQDGKLKWCIVNASDPRVFKQPTWKKAIALTEGVANAIRFTARVCTETRDTTTMNLHPDGSTRYGSIFVRSDIPIDMEEHEPFTSGQKVLIKIQNLGNQRFSASFEVEGGCKKVGQPGRLVTKFLAASLAAKVRLPDEVAAEAAREEDEFRAFKVATTDGRVPSEVMECDFAALSHLLKSKESLVTAGGLELVCNTLLADVFTEGTIKALIVRLQIEPLLAEFSKLSADNFVILKPDLPYATEAEFLAAFKAIVEKKASALLEPCVEKSVKLWLMTDLAFRFRLLKDWSDFFRVNGYEVEDSVAEDFFLKKTVVLFNAQWQDDWVGEVLIPWANPYDPGFKEKFEVLMTESFQEVTSGSSK